MLELRTGGAYRDVMLPAQDLNGESAVSNDPPDPVHCGSPLPSIGHAQVVALVGTFVVGASVVGALVVGADVVSMSVVGACVVGAGAVGAGLMQQISPFFKQSKCFCGEVSGQVATQTPSRPSKLQLFRARARERVPAGWKLLIPGMPGVADEVVVCAGVVGTGASFSMQQLSPSRKPL